MEVREMLGTQKEQELYRRMVQRHTPRPRYLRNALLAFLGGGTVSLVGQAVMTGIVSAGMTPKDAAIPTAAVMVFIGALLTGWGIYDEFGRYAGMGAALPITGFSNSIVSPSLDFKREGYVLGMSAKMFSVAGPVIVYGLVTAFFASLIRVLLVGP